MPRRRLDFPARVALGYLFIATLWIIGSDSILALLIQHPDILNNMQSFKGMAFVVVTTLLLYVILKRELHSREQAEAALAESRTRLESLSHRLLAAQEAERRHIARELHDEIGQALTALKINLFIQGKAGSADDLARRLQESIGIVDRLLEQVRSLSLDLRPSLLDDLGLAAALEWYCNRVAQRSGLEIAIYGLEAPAVPPSIAITCFRVAQEALTNVVRHANAHHVEVHLIHQGETLVLKIDDDGVGFDLAATRADRMGRTGLGLLSMYERVGLVGGRLAITSAPTAGTHISASFPLTND